VEGILNIVERVRKLASLTSLRMENVRFETESHEKLAAPCIEYQRGFLLANWNREYLFLEKVLKETLLLRL
jgi:hypothetical protein